MGTLGTRTRNGKKPAPRRAERPKAAHHELKEALEQQAATAEILRALSRASGDPQPVFKAIVEQAHRLCGAVYSILYRYDGQNMSVAASSRFSARGVAMAKRRYPAPPSRDHIVGRAILEGRPLRSTDLTKDTRFPANRNDAFSKVINRRAVLVVPLLRNGSVIGAISVGRAEAKAYTEKETGLLQTFAEHAVIAIEKVHLLNETKEALEHQKASADILRIVAGSVGNTEPVFEAITAAGTRLVPGARVALTLMREGQLHYVSHSGVSAERRAEAAKHFPLSLDGPRTVATTAIMEKRVVHLPDIEAAGQELELAQKIARVTGYRAMLTVPLLRESHAIGTIAVTRAEPGPFTEKQIELVKTFADQAVIAIENARLFNETKEALEQQTATAEILRVISSSPTDLAPVFDAILKSAMQLCEAHLGILNLYDGEWFRTVAQRGGNPQFAKWVFERGAFKPDGGAAYQAISELRAVQIADAREGMGYRERKPNVSKFVDLGGVRTFLAVPLLKDRRVIGNIGIYRPEVRPFTEKQVALVSLFANQAVIAIENVRLFNETKDALERQTATAGILQVISGSPTDIQPVLDAVAATAARLCEASDAIIQLREGDAFRFVAHHGALPNRPVGATRTMTRDTLTGRAILEGRQIHVHDLQAETKEYPEGSKYAQQYGYRTILATPLMRDGAAVGSIMVRRAEVRPFSEGQLTLVRTFADQAVIAIENVRLFNETKEALEQQTAISEVLRAISDSPAHVKPVLDAVAVRAARICDASEARIVLVDGDRIRHAAGVGHVPLPAGGSVPLDRGGVVGRAIIDRVPMHIDDVRSLPQDEFPVSRKLQLTIGTRTMLAVPLLREDRALGAILLRRMEVRPFTDKQIALLKTFADQAVIAIENARLFNETREALEQQTGTSQVLSAISGSPTDVAPVYATILENATRLCEASFAVVFLYDGEYLAAAAQRGASPAFAKHLEEGRFRPSRETTTRLAALDRRIVQVEDLLNDPDFSPSEAHRAENARAVLSVPMLREGELIGVVTVWRREPRRFSDKQVALLKTFADQAVIAIENVRLFNETREALEQQTATAEILRVISSSPSDIQPVFDSIVEHAMRLCDAALGTVGLYDGKTYRHVAQRGGSPEYVKWLFDGPFEPRPGSTMGHMIAERQPFHVPDYRELPSYREGNPRSVATVELGGARTYLAVPMLKEGRVIGGITLRRAEVRPFTQKQIDLVSTFASQAVIAIENVRLFNETREALERQTATGEILRVMSSSPSDVQPVFDMIARNTSRLCNGNYAIVTRYDGELVHLAAQHNARPGASTPTAQHYPRRPSRDLPAARAVLERAVVHIPYAEQDHDLAGEVVQRIGAQSFLAVPMLRDGWPIGAIGVSRADAGPFPAKQIELVKLFADQAVSAIENVRLFNETREALEQQTATADILKVISRSPTDVQPVFDALAETAARVCGANDVIIRRVEGDRGCVAAHFGSIPITAHSVPITRGTAHGRAILERRTIHVEDIVAEFERGEYRDTFALHGGSAYRTLLVAPLLREGGAIGAIVVRRVEKQPFSEKQVALLETFANQAVIAIENVRLFKELQARTEALSKSVGQLTALGEVGQAITSTLDLETVLKTIVQRAVQLTGLDAGSIYEYDEPTEQFTLQAAENMEQELVEAVRRTPVRKGDGAIGRSAVSLEPVQVADILDEGYRSARKEVLIRAGYRAILAVPLLREEHMLGAILVNRRTPGPFAPEVVELLKTFATQSAMAIQNARLFREIAEKGKQLEIASQHKSQFLASMSHELRTPLNALLGFNEMILGDVYGEVPGDMKPPLAQMQSSGRHLLRLINNVLDLAKIEAGRMELALSDYSVHDTVESVRSALRPLAADKGLELLAAVPEDIPLAYGDAGRITQCLMNLAGNSLKFTKAGKVEISVVLDDGRLRYSVADTGIGIPADKIESLFTEFKQTDATIASEYGGTGLGLSITKKFIEMHGGRIWVESEAGHGSTFSFEIPLRAQEAKAA